MTYEEFFSTYKDKRIEIERLHFGQSIGFTVEELFQAFRARLMDELYSSDGNVGGTLYPKGNVEI
jgi:hypothetical protein